MHLNLKITRAPYQLVLHALSHLLQRPGQDGQLFNVSVLQQEFNNAHALLIALHAATSLLLLIVFHCILLRLLWLLLLACYRFERWCGSSRRSCCLSCDCGDGLSWTAVWPLGRIYSGCLPLARGRCFFFRFFFCGSFSELLRLILVILLCGCRGALLSMLNHGLLLLLARLLLQERLHTILLLLQVSLRQDAVLSL